MIDILAIAAAGALGAVARFGLTGATQRWFPENFPGGTLLVNLLGCFMLGILAALSLERMNINPAVRNAVLIGFLGAFTTFSTFGYDTLHLMRSGMVFHAGLNILLSVGLGIGAAWAGVLVGGRC